MAENAEAVEDNADDFEAEFNKAADKKDGVAPIDESSLDGAPAADPVVAEAEQADPYEGMSEGVKERFLAMENNNSDLQHRIDSDAGRVSAFQVKINGLERQISNPVDQADTPSKDEITKALGSDEGWEKFSEDYPEVSEAIDARLNSFNKQVNETIAPVVQQQENEAQQDAYGEVAKTFPAWQDAVNTPEFSNWMATQSPGIQALAGSDDTQDASSLVGMYDDFRVTGGHTTLRADPKPDGGSVETTADEIKARRERQLQDGVTIPSRSARVDPNANSGGDFENAFNVYAAKNDAKRAF